ncbi:MAG: hypothetical protein M5T52_21345 [Ignavibacteriaceae bacterium]|nr:hypothetical protein [Ignavibacteriaceae bacterium]
MILKLFAGIYLLITLILQHQNMEVVDKNIWFYLVYIISGLIVLLVLIFTIKYLINLGEKSEDHIKRIILLDQKKIMADIKQNRIEIFLDENKESIASYVPPAKFDLDTSELEDGEHTLIIVAYGDDEKRSIRKIKFFVRNGPGNCNTGTERK